MYSRKWIKYSYNSAGHTYLKQIRKKQLTKSIFENLRIEKKFDFSKATRKFLGYHLHPYFIPYERRRIFRNIDVQQWEPRMGRRSSPSPSAARQTHRYCEYLRKKAKALCKGRLIKPAHPRSKARWIPPFPLISAERRSRIAGSPPRKASL